MIESCVFELVNMYPLKIFEKTGNREEYQTFVDKYKESFEWCKSLTKIYFDDSKLPKV